MQIMYTVVNAAALCWGAVTDHKRREISNLVPVILLATGSTRTEEVPMRLILLCTVGLILWIAGRITGQGVPGGDFKLLCALSFTAGLVPLFAILMCTSAEVVLVGAVKRLPLDRHIPLCSYVAPAYLICRAAAAVIL